VTEQAARDVEVAALTRTSDAGGDRGGGVSVSAPTSGHGHVVVPPEVVEGATPAPPETVRGSAPATNTPALATTGDTETARASSRCADTVSSAARGVASHDAAWAADAATERSASPSPAMQTRRVAWVTTPIRVFRK